MTNTHIVNQIREQFSLEAKKTAMREYDHGKWNDISWKEFGKQTDELTLALHANNIGVQENVGIFSNNMPRWTVADMAIMQSRGVVVPIYPTNTPKQTAYIIDNASVRILFVGEQAQYNAAVVIFDQCESLQLIVAMSDKIDLNNHSAGVHWNNFLVEETEELTQTFQTRLDEKSNDDLFTLIYTSGTTGEPKGVMLDYNNIGSQCASHKARLPVTSEDVSLCFLPLSHVYERSWTLFVLSQGVTNCYLPDTNLIKNALVDVKPTLMCAVPRFYEKIYSAVFEKVSRAPAYRKVMFTWAVNMGAKVADANQQGLKTSFMLRKMYALADKLVLSKLRAVLGGRINFMPCGGAMLDPTIGKFFHAIGINIKLGYGMTETTATVSCWDDENFDPDSIGKIMPGVDIKIGEQNEILVRGPMVMKGYYNNPEETAKNFDEEGYLKTGDAGKFENGNLFITDRIKELMKTSNGKYIAPQHIEGTLGKDHFIEQIVIIADTKKFVSALIVPCYETLEEYSKELNIIYHDRMDLIKNSHIMEMFEKRVHELQKELSKFEQVKKFTLLTKSFSMDKGELTPTQKIRRKVINTRYKEEIDDMYDGQKKD